MIRTDPLAQVMQQPLETLYRREYRYLFATLVRLLRDFDLAEDALQEAFTVALQTWSDQGWPDNPRAWLISTARFKAIDKLRKHAREVAADGDSESLVAAAEDFLAASADADDRDPIIEDDQLRLIFTCCHPALTPEDQVALTLREVCGLPTEAIARAFLLPTATLAQRLVRGKAKIRNARIAFVLPPPEQLQERLDAALAVVYLVFSEGARQTDPIEDADLAEEAIRLGRLLWQLIPASEVAGLLALMLLHQSRRAARFATDGALVVLEEQDRRLWDRTMAAEGAGLVRRALSGPTVGAYALQAAIAALHCEADDPAATDWPQIVALYDLLLQANASPVVELNRAVAVAMRDGAEAGLELIGGLLQRKQMQSYVPLHVSRGELLRRLGQRDLARQAYLQALSLHPPEREREFLERRLAEIAGAGANATHVGSA